MSFALETSNIALARQHALDLERALGQLGRDALGSSLDSTFSTVSGLDSTGLTNGLALRGTEASAHAVLLALSKTLQGTASNLQALSDGASTTDISYAQGFDTVDEGGTGGVDSPFLAEGFSGVESSPLYKQLPVIPIPPSLLGLEAQMVATAIGQAADANSTWGKLIGGLTEATAEIFQVANTVQAAGHGAAVDEAVDSIRSTANTSATFTANASAMRGHVDALWNAKIGMHNYVRQAIDIVAAAGAISPAHASQMDLALRSAYVPMANTALAPAQPIPVTLTSANAPSPGSIVDAGRNAVNVASTVASVIDNVQWPNSARQELVSQLSQHPGEFTTAEQAAELIDTLHPYSGAMIDPGQLGTGTASTGVLTPAPTLGGPGVPVGTAPAGITSPSVTTPGVLGTGVSGAVSGLPSHGTATPGNRAATPLPGSVPVGSGMVGAGAGRGSGGVAPGRTTGPNGADRASRGGASATARGGADSPLRGSAPVAGAPRLNGPDSPGQNGAHQGGRSTGGSAAGASTANSSHGGSAANGRPGMMMGGPMAGAGGRGGKPSAATGAKAVTSQVERAGNLRDLLGERPAVVPGVIGSWVFDQPR